MILLILLSTTTTVLSSRFHLTDAAFPASQKYDACVLPNHRVARLTHDNTRAASEFLRRNNCESAWVSEFEGMEMDAVAVLDKRPFVETQDWSVDVKRVLCEIVVDEEIRFHDFTAAPVPKFRDFKSKLTIQPQFVDFTPRKKREKERRNANSSSTTIPTIARKPKPDTERWNFCPICLALMPEMVQSTRCNHRICKGCSQMVQACPMCRAVDITWLPVTPVKRGISCDKCQKSKEWLLFKAHGCKHRVCRECVNGQLDWCPLCTTNDGRLDHVVMAIDPIDQ